MITKTLNSFRFALNGILIAWKEEVSFKIQVVVAVLVVLCMFLFNFSSLEDIICIFAITLVLSAEIINTALEDLCNIVEPNQSPIIGKIKDLSSAFVLVTSIGAGIIGLIVFFHHF